MSIQIKRVWNSILHFCTSTTPLPVWNGAGHWSAKWSWAFRGIFIDNTNNKKIMLRIILQKNSYSWLFRPSATQCLSYTPASGERTYKIRQGAEQRPEWGLAPVLRDKSARICHNQNKHLQSVQSRWEIGKNNPIVMARGDLAPSSIWSGHKHFMRTEENQLSSEIDVPNKETQPHFAGCDNIPNNAIWEKEWESRRSRRDLNFTSITKI